MNYTRSYISYARHELRKNHDWNQKIQRREKSKYSFPWTKIDDSKIRTEGFEPKLFEFNLDQAKILQLLVGHTLYNDSTVVIRELVQNSIDAIRLQNYISDNKDKYFKESDIIIDWDNDNRILSFSDNGTGMTQEIIEDHLLKVGSSRYQSDSFIKRHPDFNPISRFGIGILTCFLIADNVEITTSHIEENQARKLTIRNVDGKYLLQHLDKSKLDDHISSHGTKISLQVRASIDMSDLKEQIDKWVIFPPCSVILKRTGLDNTTIGFKSPKEAIEKYLTNINYEVDGINIKVVEDEIDGVKIAYGLKFNYFYKEWSFIPYPHHDRTSHILGVGTCIEGIRVEFNTPGFMGNGPIAIVNASGKHAPKTNVARSTIESTNGKSNFLKIIYRLYINHVKSEIAAIQENNNFSLTWAANEIDYLLQPLIDNEEEQESVIAIDHDLFLSEIAETELVLIEDNFKRILASVNYVNSLDEIWSIDCNSFRSAEALIGEINSSSSILELMKTLYHGNTEKLSHIKVLLCGFNISGPIQMQLLSKRSINTIKIFPTERRVDISWSNEKNTKWIKIPNVKNLSQSYRRRDEKTFYIQNTSDEIQELGSINIIECFDLVFIVKGTPIHDFLLKYAQILNLESNGDDLEIMKAAVGFMNDIYGPDLDQRVMQEKQVRRLLEEHYIRNSGLYTTDVWRKIDKEEYISAITNTEWKLFTPAAWNRSRRMIDDSLPF